MLHSTPGIRHSAFGDLLLHIFLFSSIFCTRSFIPVLLLSHYMVYVCVSVSVFYSILYIAMWMMIGLNWVDCRAKGINNFPNKFHSSILQCIRCAHILHAHSLTLSLAIPSSLWPVCLFSIIHMTDLAHSIQTRELLKIKFLCEDWITFLPS